MDGFPITLSTPPEHVGPLPEAVAGAEIALITRAHAQALRGTA